MSRKWKKIASIIIVLFAIAAIILVWYRNGFDIVKYDNKIEDVPIQNMIYLLDNGDVIEQYFQTNQDYLAGFEVLLVNTSAESTGDLVIELYDMWGDLVKRSRLELKEVLPGEYVFFPLSAELDAEENEELQIKIYSSNADPAPGMVFVNEKEDVVENGYCYYNGDLVKESGLVLGYVYGKEQFVGYQYVGRKTLELTIIETFLVILLCGVSIYFLFAFNIKKAIRSLKNYNTLFQLLFIFLIFSLFLLSAVINKIDSVVIVPIWVYVWLFVTILFFVILVCLYSRDIVWRKLPVVKTYGSIKFEWPIAAIAIFYVISRLPMLVLTRTQSWDAAIYYGALNLAQNNFNFTVESVWNNFRIAQHYTLMYTFFMLIGEFLTPGNAIGAEFIMAILSIVALTCVYRMLRSYWCHMTTEAATVSTLLLAVIPLFWGTSAYISADYTLPIFFIFMVYAEFRNQTIMQFFWMITLMLNKETGWAIVAGYCVAYFIKLWKYSKGEPFIEKVRHLARNPMLKGIVVCAICVILYAIRQGGLFVWMDISVTGIIPTEEVTGGNLIGYYVMHDAIKLKQMFILNFMWIPTFLIGLSSIILFKRRKIQEHRVQNLEGVVGGFAAFWIFNMIYITAELSRYTTYSAVIIWLIAIVLVWHTIVPALSKRLLTGAVGIVMFLLCLQTFVFIDPVSNLVFTKMETGKGKLLSTNIGPGNYGDTFVNNYRYAYIENLLDKMLRETDYSQDMQIITIGDKNTVFVGGNGQYKLVWDKLELKRVYTGSNADGENLIPINQLHIDDLEAIEEKGIKEKAIVYFLPYYGYDETDYLERLEQFYYIGERRVTSNWGGTVAYYLLEKK